VWWVEPPRIHYGTQTARVECFQGSTSSPSVAISARYCTICPELTWESEYYIKLWHFSTCTYRQQMRYTYVRVPGWCSLQEGCCDAFRGVHPYFISSIHFLQRFSNPNTWLSNAMLTCCQLFAAAVRTASS